MYMEFMIYLMQRGGSGAGGTIPFPVELPFHYNT